MEYKIIFFVFFFLILQISSPMEAEKSTIADLTKDEKLTIADLTKNGIFFNKKKIDSSLQVSVLGKEFLNKNEDFLTQFQQTYDRITVQWFDHEVMENILHLDNKVEEYKKLYFKTIEKYYENMSYLPVIAGHANSTYDLVTLSRTYFKQCEIAYAQGKSTREIEQTYFKTIYGEDLEESRKQAVKTIKLLEKPFIENTLAAKWELESPKNIPTHSCFIPSMHKNEEDKKSLGYGMTFASGLDFEGIKSHDFIICQKLMTKATDKGYDIEKRKELLIKALEELLEMRIEQWFQASFGLFKQMNPEHFKFLICSEVGLGCFAEKASVIDRDLGFSLEDLKPLYYEVLRKIITTKHKNHIKDNNIKIVFFSYNSGEEWSVLNTSFIEKGLGLKIKEGESMQWDDENLFCIVKTAESLFSTQWITKHIYNKSVTEENSSFVINHAGDAHAYFNNGCLDDNSLERRAWQFDWKNNSMNMAPVIANLCLTLWFHKDHGYHKQLTLEYQNSIQFKDLLFKIFKKEIYFGKRESVLKEIERLKTSTKSIPELLEEHQITLWTSASMEQVKESYKKRVPVYCGVPFYALYNENKWNELHTFCFPEKTIKKEKEEEIKIAKEDRNTEKVYEVLTGWLPNLAKKKEDKLPKEIFFCHTYGINFESKGTSDYQYFSSLTTLGEKKQAFIEQTKTHFILALQAIVKSAASKSSINILWPRIGFDCFSHFINDIFGKKITIDGETVTGIDIYKYLAILGYQEAIKEILPQLKKNQKINIIFNTANYSSDHLDEGAAVCEQYYKKLIINYFKGKEYKNISCTISSKNIFNPNLTDYKPSLEEDGSFVAFLNSGDPMSFPGNRGACDTTLEGCLLGYRHALDFKNQPITLLPQTLAFFWYIFQDQELMKKIIKVIERPAEKPLKQEKIKKITIIVFSVCSLIFIITINPFKEKIKSFFHAIFEKFFIIEKNKS